MEYLMPERLASGSTVGVYSPSDSISDSGEKATLFENGLARLRSLGFDVRESTNCRSSWYHASAPPADRAADLHELVADPDIDIILPSIGGHVASQLLPLLDFDAIAASGKVLVGWSDNAIIAVVVTDKTGLCTFHSACEIAYGFGRFAEGAFPLTEASFLTAVRSREFDLSGNRNWRAIQTGESSGVLLGGSLRGLMSLAGTPWWPDWRGKIMFWESSDPLHTAARRLVHLANAGAFDDLAGMVIGRINPDETSYRPDQVIPIEILLLDVLGLRGRFPIVIGADIGHNVENVTIPLGATARLRVDDGIELTVDSPPGR